ncbi:protein MEI2-like 4 isoform X2 [Iris pallida]|uniref:Protein MEI2-like 4 isoform X2 n=1 Tax=Iris pallida TaxID=29817 RepID=A0AAX6EG37_IRIPA|nr:protein MEI2-like 4 isoform X2 [Iris pallida]
MFCSILGGNFKMPSEIMDHRRRLSASFFSEELSFPAEKQMGFWKMEPVPNPRGIEEMPIMSGSRSVSSSPLEKLRPVGTSSAQSLELQHNSILKDQKTKFGLENQFLRNGKATGLSMNSWRASDQESGFPPNMNPQSASLFSEGSKVDLNGVFDESGIFSSSMSELFNRKMKISSNIVPLGQSVGIGNLNFGDDEPVESLKEIEAQTIGNLLPDDDDLLSGVIDDIGYMTQPNNRDDVDDDIFCSLGGMELEVDDHCAKIAELMGAGTFNGLLGGLSSPFAGEHPYGEHPSRTLFVRNINSNVEDAELRVLFEKYGDIRTLYTACKHRGFVMISYYDIRAARDAMKALQNTPMRRRKLDIHFSIPKDNPSEKDINQGTLVVFNLDSSVSNDDLLQKFGIYGEIKEIRETPHKRHHKFIEFYDVRAAEAALRALNRSDIAGKKIKLEPSRPGGARRSLMQQFPDVDVEESNGGRGSPLNDSPPGSYGSLQLGAISSTSVDNETAHGLHSAVRGPVSLFGETTNNGISSCVSQNMSSPVRVTSLGSHRNLSGHGDLCHSLGQVKFGFQGMPIMHPHSLPEYHDGMSNGIPYNSSAMPPMFINKNSRHGEGFDNRYVQRSGSGSIINHSFEHNEGGNGNCPVHGNQYLWNNSNAYPHLPSGPMMWSGSPSFVNIHPQQMRGLPRAPSHMLNSVVPLHPHHVGSAPVINPSLWERRQPYIGDSTDAPNFHPGSLGSTGFPGSSAMHPLELAHHNMFPHSAGSCLDPSISSPHMGIASPQQRCQIFHGRSHIIPVPGSFDVPNDRVRSRRNDSNANQGDNKKQYELDIECILLGEDLRTTLMIKNIPNKYTSKMLLAAIDEQHKGTYNFIYLPIDFKNKCNVGYAFINMIDPRQIIPFFQAFNGKKWEKFNSEKVASLAYARIQGKSALIAHFQNSSLMNEDKRCRPILFHSDGPNAGDQEPFPMGVNIRSRPGGSRTCNEENHQGSPSTSPSGADSSNGMNTAGSAKDSE